MANHPHIVEMKGAFLTPYYLALVMEYVEGETVEVGYGYQGGGDIGIRVEGIWVSGWVGETSREEGERCGGV